MRYLIFKVGSLSSERVLHTGGRLKVGNWVYFKRREDSYWSERWKARVTEIVRDKDQFIQHVKVSL